MATLSLITILAYLVAWLTQVICWRTPQRISRAWFFIIAFIAVITHGCLLHWWIDIPAGQNLTYFNMFSLIVWLVSLFVVLAAIPKPVEMLALFIFPVSILSIVLVLVFPAFHVIDTAQDPQQLVHILLSVITMSVLALAGIQAILLAIQEHQLRKQPSNSLLQRLPPLDAMESLLFQIIWLGFILLSVVIISGFISFHQLLIQHWLVKIVLVMLGWLVYAVLLVGRYVAGWRGRQAIYYTLGGVIVLAIAYFGTKLMLEFIL